MKKSVIAIILLVFCVIFSACSGNSGENENQTTTDASALQTTAYVPPAELTYLTTIGSGENSFVLETVTLEGESSKYLIATNETDLEKALESLGLLTVNEYTGEITDVNGIHAEYNKDGMHWVLYVNGEKAEASPDEITVIKNYVYTFRLEK